MEVARISSSLQPHMPLKLGKFLRNPRRVLSLPNPVLKSAHRRMGTKFQLYTAATEISDELDSEVVGANQTEKLFDWYSEWYPIMPVCDLDKRVPHGKKVLGLDLVVWWDRNENAWKVFDDSCPHRLAPLSEGRIDQRGRLQCVYHGWCFNGYGDCKFIPQAPPDGPPVHSSKRACVTVYPSTVQNEIVWFWPNSDPKYKDILVKKRPPFFPELDDPSYVNLVIVRDIEYGYEILIENLLDPSHVPYSHYGIFQLSYQSQNREGGRPLQLRIEKFDVNGFTGNLESVGHEFIAPCIYHFFPENVEGENNESVSSTGNIKNSPSKVTKQRSRSIFFCVPVSPGKSRLILVSSRNFDRWINNFVPRWIAHMKPNLILDSDTYLLRVQEHKIMEIGPSNWAKACYLPAKADALVVGYRRWLNKYAGGQVDWGGKYSGSLPPIPPREQLLDRYWSHVVNCRSCSGAYKALNIAEVALQAFAITAIGAVAVTKQQGVLSAAAASAVVAMAILSFAVSRWLSHFIYKYFHFHDYNHALL